VVVETVDLGVRTVPYREGWELQRRVHAEVADGTRPDTLLLLEHEEVFTAGSRTQPQDRPVDGSEVIDVDRGGRITWHGPGQLVGYPIVRLPHPMDVVAYVRSLEDLLIRVCAGFAVAGERISGRSGVWVAEHGSPAKVAAIGVRVTRGTTMHGFALNCDCDVAWAERIVPCGIADAGVTSLTIASGMPVTVVAAADAIQRTVAV
jgi:lipoyl(octanoyl) transferase